MASTTADKYLQDFQNTIKTNSAALKGIKAGYDTMYQNYANGLVNDGTFQAIENARSKANTMTNSQFDNSAKNYYTMYRQNQMAMPEKLSNLGVTGGASETALLKLMNQYSGNMYNNENQRNTTLNTTNMQYDQQIADNSKNIAQQLADTYLKLAQQAREEVLAEEERKRQEALAAAEAARAASYSYGGSGGYSSDSYTPTVAPSGVKPVVSKPIVSTTTSKYKETYGTTSKAKKKSTGGSGTGSSKARTYNVSMYK